MFKSGFPGAILLEGREDDCVEFVKRLKHLPWQALQVRMQETSEGEVSESAFRRFSAAAPFHEITEAEGGLSVMASRCEQVGLKELFMSILKL